MVRLLDLSATTNKRKRCGCARLLCKMNDNITGLQQYVAHDFSRRVLDMWLCGGFEMLMQCGSWLIMLALKMLYDQ